MTTTINVSGLTSGVQWGDIVDTTVKALEARTVTPISDTLAKRTAQGEAWASFRTIVDRLNEQARAVRRTGFSGFLATTPPSPTTSRTLLTAAPTENAVAGRYRVEVLQVAESAKLAGKAVANTTTALGYAGDLTINGQTITLAATDTLRNIQTKINAANSGTNATGVTATIISEGGTAGRLVLTAANAGSNGIDISDSTGGVARELGLIDTRSKPVSSAVQAAAAAMGMSVFPAPASIRVGEVVITADLENDSLSAIAAKINAAGGAASVEAEAYGDETRYRLIVDGNVSAVNGDPDSQAVIDALGFAAGMAGTVRQTVQSPLYTGSDDNVATASTALAGLKVDGTSAGLAVGDAINIRGMRGDGTAVTIGLVVEQNDTMQTLLDRINDATSGFAGGARPASAALGEDGRIRLTDGTGGASRLALSMSVTRADGSAGTLGAAAVSVTGRSREVQVGRDAVIRVDGREITRTSNTITDAIGGVTLTLANAEPGSAIDVVIDRDVKGGLDAVQKLADIYNEVRTFFDEQRQPGAALYANSSLRSIVDGFTAALRTKVSTNDTYSSLAVSGLALDRNGMLKVDATALRKALEEKPAEIEALLGFGGVGSAFVTATDDATRFGTGTISSQVSSIDSSKITLRQREAEARAKLDQKREQLVAQFTRMEEAMSRLQAQSATLLSSVQSLQPKR